MSPEELLAETDTGRNDRHKQEIRDCPRDEWDRLFERHRLEWLNDPTQETLDRRVSDKSLFGIRGKRGDGPEDPPAEGEEPPAPKRRPVRRQTKRR